MSLTFYYNMLLYKGILGAWNGFKKVLVGGIIMDSQKMIEVSIVSLGAVNERFIIEEKFQGSWTELKPGTISKNFKDWFFDKEEPIFKGSSLRILKMVTSLTDKQIVNEVGGDESQVEISFSEMFYFLCEHAQQAIWYNFFLRDNSNILRAIFVILDVDDHGESVVVDVLAFPIEDKERYSKGHFLVVRA